MIHLRVPATAANLGPGFDSFGIALNLYNDFIIKEIKEEAFPADFSLLPKNNLIANAVQLFAKEAGKPLPNFEYGIRAQIPRARGLGSSATLTIAGLKAADSFLGTNLSDAQLIALGSKLEGHPDNAAPALLGGFVISVKEQNEVKYLKSIPPHPLEIIVGVPEFELQTTKSRKALPNIVSFSDATFNIGRAGLLAATLISGQYELLRYSMADRLHQPYRKPLIIGLDKVMDAVMENGALGTCLSGSGPTVLVFCQKPVEKLQQIIEKTWLEAGIKARTYHLKIANNGVELT